ncbi:MAG: glycosyltransferase [Gammaproteobacteria bacterium]|jgi:glycosyltransferase involved in cell wall biosynthesis|nr:glycosyltransferase [Gammaproteobacteria bacterium]
MTPANGLASPSIDHYNSAMPPVSICIPTYNHGRFIADCLRSAMMQTYRDLEIIVLDNASEDDTREIVARVAANDPRVRYVRHPTNTGLIGNLNACIEYARGTYVKLLCSDDLLEPECVADMVEVLDRHAEVSLVGCARTLTDVNIMPGRIARARSEFACIPGEQMIAECFFFGNRIGEPTAVMFRRAAALRGFSPQYNQLVDLEMWFHLLRKGDFAALPAALCKIRVHAGQTSRANEHSGRTIADRQRLFRDFSIPAGQSAGVLRKLTWDFRMAYIVARIAPVDHHWVRGPLTETFFPQLFGWLTYPLVRLIILAGLAQVWKAA